MIFTTLDGTCLDDDDDPAVSKQLPATRHITLRKPSDDFEPHARINDDDDVDDDDDILLSMHALLLRLMPT